MTNIAYYQAYRELISFW